MKVVGIHDGHTATVCYVDNGKVKSAISEERLNKVKGSGGFPVLALKHIFETEKITARDLNAVALVGKVKPLTNISQYAEGRQKFFPKLIKFMPLDPRILIRAYVSLKAGARLNDTTLRENFRSFGIDPAMVTPVEHHQTHAATAYYLSPFHARRDKTLVITLDGSGDGLSGTVATVSENAKWQRLAAFSTFDSLGMIYSRTTQLLAMKPWEHEYKLMGMAPYAHKDYAERCLRIMERYISLSADGLAPQNRTRLWGNSLLEQMHADLRRSRFDAVSAAVQLLHERIVVELVRNWARKSGVGKIAVAGGCFMNIKANKLIAELAECEELFVMPSCGDESCAIGAALTLQAEREPGVAIEPLRDLYWGTEFNAAEIENYLNANSAALEFKKSGDIERESAELLSKHKMIGRVSGRMEWGARALGNRSIIANPSRAENLRKLNAAIKMRDFWMPFAPSILWESRKDYARFPKEIEVYHMTLGFDSTELARQHIIAALHPYDLSMRPQFVRRDHNPKYHALISHFKELTGIGGVLNTSFNLHGMPIVNGPDDAIYTLLNSDLDFVTINDYLVWKKPSA